MGNKIAAVICVVAGLILVGHFIYDGLKGSDIIELAIGLYFVGKGIFIVQLLSLLSKKN